MFYPVESLKRGGRFYLCWVADSWPLRFATITHRQLWSQDIRRICDDLMEVMVNESGRPTNRFSLRLSSQLMRGLVRLYQRKVTVFLSDLCMINANVFKNTNKKWNVHEITEDIQRPQLLQTNLPLIPEVILQDEPENEQRIEEMIQKSRNLVSNIQEITLKETAIPEFQLPNDGFGEEHPEQALELVLDRTLETMMRGDESAPHHSALDLADQSRDAPHDPPRAPRRRQMERLSGYDVTALARVSGDGLLPAADFEKEIPDISEIPLPELHAPLPENRITEPEDIVLPRSEPANDARGPETSRREELVEIELEELETIEPPTKRRRVKNKLIIDRKIKLSGSLLRARIENPAVDLRCEDSSDDIVEIRVPWECYSRRPCHAGRGFYSNLSPKITRLFLRSLVVGTITPLADREMEEIMQRSHRPRVRSLLERIQEVEEPILERPSAPPINILPSELNVTNECVLDVTKPRYSDADKQLDISDMPTQKIDTLSQARKRSGVKEAGDSVKRQRSMGYVSFRESQRMDGDAVPVPVADQAEKENIPEVYHQVQQTPKRYERSVLQEIPTEEEQHQQLSKEAEKSVTALLQEAGLADIQPHQALQTGQQPPSDSHKSRRRGSEGSETPLGSLDRTKVSIGDSDQTTDSKRFIRDQWGTEGTMVKILKCLKAEVVPLTVWNLISKGPVIPGYKKIIIARCFTSILKLKQHGFVKISKDPDTLEILDITLGPKFD